MIKGGNEIMKILIIGDSKDLANKFCEWLAQEGYETLQANSELEAEEVLRKNSKVISISIVDIELPQKNKRLDFHESGLRIIKQITKNYPTITPVVLTGRPNIEMCVKCMQAGAINYIVKGEDPDLIHQLIVNAQHEAERKKQVANINHTLKTLPSLIENTTTAVNEAVTNLEEIRTTFQRIQEETEAYLK
jgi:DNA-binding NtrC family response regulator